MPVLHRQQPEDTACTLKLPVLPRTSVYKGTSKQEVLVVNAGCRTPRRRLLPAGIRLRPVQPAICAWPYRVPGTCRTCRLLPGRGHLKLCREPESQQGKGPTPEHTTHTTHTYPHIHISSGSRATAMFNGFAVAKSTAPQPGTAPLADQAGCSLEEYVDYDGCLAVCVLPLPCALYSSRFSHTHTQHCLCCQLDKCPTE